MLPILTKEQIKKTDFYTIENQPIRSIDLMERAATNCYNKINKIIIKDNHIKTIHIFCGLGNNGGDGLVIARKFKEDDFCIKVYKLDWGQNVSNDFVLNEERLIAINTEIITITKELDFPEINKNDVIIDSIWGIGLSRPIENFAGEIINKINKTEALVISIDIPSGLSVIPDFKLDYNKIINADYTFTFEFPKLSFLLPLTGNYPGVFKVIPIGLDEDFISKQETKNYYIDDNCIKKILKKRNKFSHKGDYGHALIIAGSIGKMGAAILSSKSCLKSGAGLLTVQVPECGYDTMQKIVPEAMVIKDNGVNYLESIIQFEKFSSIGIGPGIDQKLDTYKLVYSLLNNYDAPIVIDADAINIISNNLELLEIIPFNSILTPHPGEFKRLVGDWKNDLERLEKLINFSMDNNVYVILKGAHSSIGCPDGKILFNSTGNPGMATAGSGDVLTGIITALLCQGYSSKEASILGTYFHGLSGDIVKEKIGEISLNASDIVENISDAFKLFQ